MPIYSALGAVWESLIRLLTLMKRRRDAVFTDSTNEQLALVTVKLMSGTKRRKLVIVSVFGQMNGLHLSLSAPNSGGYFTKTQKKVIKTEKIN